MQTDAALNVVGGLGRRKEGVHLLSHIVQTGVIESGGDVTYVDVLTGGGSLSDNVHIFKIQESGVKSSLLGGLLHIFPLGVVLVNRGVDLLRDRVVTNQFTRVITIDQVHRAPLAVWGTNEQMGLVTGHRFLDEVLQRGVSEVSAALTVVYAQNGDVVLLQSLQ